MSTSEEETTTPEVSDETSGESGADSSNVESSADDPSSPSNEGSSPSTSGNDTPPKKERFKRKSRHLRAHRRGKKSRRPRKSTDETTTDGTDTPQSTDETPEKSSAEEQDSPAPESSGDESPAADPNWTMSEDVILVNMKKDDRKPSWTEIAQAMHKSKKDIKARWKILRDKTEQQPSSQEEEEEEEDPSEPEVEQQQQPERKTKKSRKRRGKRASKHKPSPQAEETIVLSGEDASAEASPDDGPADQKSPSSSSEADSLTYAGSDREIRRQKRYLQRHIRAKLFPPDKYPTADETFSQEDCEILASVESQYKISKCLEMQANFYNVTGRLVPIELIRARCEKEEGTH
ncbi:unnamed protein product [Clonostachys byssicola]|uniref:Myb-like domain-containing protein n=1 Tax=Clonostachys byssicola TaxID=160290 RepID=A0A9N9Y851_9HYPO|nr:unnamed protein product [Clonostachys byssicola]